METVGSAARYPSPLRYPGGKGKIANYLKLVIIENSLNGVRYVEPYAGGASVALSLLFEEYVGQIHINDLNKGVFSFWRHVLDDPDSLCRRITEVPLTVEEWKRQKAIQSDPDALPVDLAFSTFYLNRTNRSGIIARGGVIGGNEQRGRWKIGARFNRESLCARVNKVARFGSRITVSMQDAEELILSEAETGNRLLYLDPPYYIKGARLYDNFYSHEDHVKICAAVQKAVGPWVVSYDATPDIMSMYLDCESLRYLLSYSASKVTYGTEVMFFSSGLIVPDVASPARITPQEVAKCVASRSV